jgi:hypothetical protein
MNKILLEKAVCLRALVKKPNNKYIITSSILSRSNSTHVQSNQVCILFNLIIIKRTKKKYDINNKG